MPEPKSSFAARLLDRGNGEDAKSFTSERQQTAQAFNLHVELRDGRRAEGFPWAHYAGYRWADEGEHERLVLLFGTRALEIEGYNLMVLVEDIRECQLNGIKEMVSAQAELKHANASEEPVISNIRMYPDFEELLKEIKGDDREAGHAGRVRGR
jgi:hypothetical protein